LLETGHSLAPIILAWTHRGFRREVILANPQKYILLPAALFGVAAAIGIATSLGWTSYSPGRGQMFHLTEWANPFPVVMWVYWIWNIYHFGMQHYGVSRLCGIGYGRVCMVVCLGVTAFGMGIVPMLTQNWTLALLMTGVWSVNHWVVDIGLSGRVAGWWLPVSVVILGAVGFAWMIPTANGMMIRVIPAIIGARVGLGFVHFLYSRWVWRMSDAKVRSTIGRGLIPVQT
jgi:hypothetical protein